MARKPYEVWAPERITALRSQARSLDAEADSLEGALKSYLADQGRPEPETKPAAPVTAAGDWTTRFVPQTSDGAPAPQRARRVGPGSKSAGIEGYVLRNEARGADLHEIYKYVEANWPGTPTNIIRSLVWHAKKAERLLLRGNRYYAPRYAPPAENGALLPEPTPGIRGEA